MGGGVSVVSDRGDRGLLFLGGVLSPVCLCAIFCAYVFIFSVWRVFGYTVYCAPT